MRFIKEKLGDRGIAMVFTIGILAMTLITAVILISSASLDRMSAKNYESVQQSRMYAQSGLQRVLVGMKLYGSDTSFDMNKIYSCNPEIGTASQNSDTVIYYEGLSGPTGLLADTICGTSYSIDADSYSTLSSKPTWIYIRSGTSATSPIIGRIAYQLIAAVTSSDTSGSGMTGRINPSACLDSGENAVDLGMNAVSEANSAGNLGAGDGTGSLLGKDGTEYTSLGPGGTYVVGRPGRDMNEVFLRCMDNSQLWLSASGVGKYYNQKISSVYSSPAGTLTSLKWPDFTTLFAGLNPTSAEQTLFQKYFILDSPADSEVFSTDTSLSAGTLYHRFNLARNDWNSMTPDLLFAQQPQSLSQYSGNSTDGKSIPWITNWTYTPNSYWTADSMRHQIAANIIDYSDIDDSSTTDSPDAPSYTGLDKSPYINELRITVDPYVSQTGSGSKRTYTCTVDISNVEVEVCDLYNSGVATTAEVRMQGSYRWVFNLVNVGNGTFDVKVNVPINASTAIGKYTSGSYTVLTNIDTALSPASYSGQSNNRSSFIDQFKFSKITVKLKNTSNSHFYDFSYIVDSNYVGTDTIVTSANNSHPTQPYFYYFDFQTNDPRQNLYPADWGGDSPLYHGTGSTSPDYQTLGLFNQNVSTPNPGGINADSEPLGAGTNMVLSTAYIRNAPMKSPWELGLIHRGEDWQTINLKKYDSSKGITQSLTAGGGAYASGDANILDQIKMTSATSVTGKFDLNSSVDTSVFNALFEKIRVKSAFEINGQGPGTLLADTVRYGAGTTVSEVLDTMATTLTGAAKAASAGNQGGRLYSRAQLLSSSLSYPFWNDLIFSYSGIQNNDARKEEIIGKFINLTKAEIPGGTNYYVIVVSQSIKDLSNNAGGSSTGAYDRNKDKVLSTQKIIGQITKDPNDPTKLILTTYYQYAN